MKTLDEDEVLWKLSEFKFGDTIRVRYEPFGAETDHSILESQTAADRGQDMNVFVGTYENVKTNKDNEVYFLIYTPCRDHLDENGELRRGNWRAFNPTKGRVLGLRKVS